MFEIIKGVPIPDHGNTVYPFDKMEVGDMFEIPAVVSAASARVQMSKANAAGNKEFASRKLDNGTVGIWRIK